MKNLDKTQAKNETQRYIPMIVTPETIRDYGIKPEDTKWMKFGEKRKRVLMIPATEEQYHAFMRPMWREDKRKQRHCDEGSLEELSESNQFEAEDTFNLEADVEKRQLLEELHRALDELEELDRTIMEMFSDKRSEAEIGKAIGMSQKGVNKRKHKILQKLKAQLKDFE